MFTGAEILSWLHMVGSHDTCGAFVNNVLTGRKQTFGAYKTVFGIGDAPRK